MNTITDPSAATIIIVYLAAAVFCASGVWSLWRAKKKLAEVIAERPHPPLGSYGPNNEGLPDISTGWHIFADGNAWCAVGPTYIDLQASDTGWGHTPDEAYRDLMRVLRGTDVFDLLNRPQLADFNIHQPTVKPNAR